MWQKIAITGAVAAAIVGVGTAAVATSGPSTTPGTPTTSSGTNSAAGAAAKGLRKHPGLARAFGKRLVHGQVVTQDPNTKQLVTHDFIHGTVSSVSATSITVTAADKTSETFVVNSDTKVRLRTAGKSGSKGSIGDVKSGDQVIVIGTGTSTFTATGILDGV
ncbi:MAG TPA: hypothetical protein VKQ07_05640 [Jatrophihabitantaceae bacterium]|nr:hypothetical protein [Jatrophihabitantaceae bacterium]